VCFHFLPRLVNSSLTLIDSLFEICLHYCHSYSYDFLWFSICVKLYPIVRRILHLAYPYASIEAGSCYCGTDVSSSPSVSASLCNIFCSDNSLCGGFDGTSVYSEAYMYISGGSAGCPALSSTTSSSTMSSTTTTTSSSTTMSTSTTSSATFPTGTSRIKSYVTAQKTNN